jgi:hypothetical protein
MSLVLQSTGGGSVTVNEPTTASNFTVTLPAATGEVMVSGNMPAFSAYRTTNQTGVSNATFTKLQFTSEFFDTNSNYDSVTNYRFTPTVAGYYQVNGNICAETSTAITRVLISLYKNGVEYMRGGDILAGNAVSLSSVVYMNGTTDYLELYGYLTGTGLLFRCEDVASSFSASMVRAA